MLRAVDLHVAYGRFEVLQGVSLKVDRGEIISVIGANGAGKSTLVRSLSGFLPCRKGQVWFDGKDVTGLAPEKIVRRGLIQVLEGRKLFASMSVIDNLLLGAYPHSRQRERIRQDLSFVYSLFPVLKERSRQTSGSLSGGEQQMLAFGRALMAQPKFLVLDEPSVGLAPRMIEEIFAVIGELHRRGIPILLIEQNAYAALQISKRAYVLKNGRVWIQAASEEIISNLEISQAYLGR